MLLTRQKLPTLQGTGEGGVAKGGYILADFPDGQEKRALLLATGSELHLAMQARDALTAEGVGARVVSMPCWEVFAEQSTDYQNEVLPDDVQVRVAVEAGISQGWHRWLGRGRFIGMTGYGASAPIDQLYEHFGITVEAIVKAVNIQ